MAWARQSPHLGEEWGCVCVGGSREEGPPHRVLRHPKTCPAGFPCRSTVLRRTAMERSVSLISAWEPVVYYVNSICESFLSSWRNRGGGGGRGREQWSSQKKFWGSQPGQGRGAKARTGSGARPGFQTLVPWHSGPGLAFPFGGTCRLSRPSTIAESE